MSERDPVVIYLLTDAIVREVGELVQETFAVGNAQHEACDG